jgi:ElaB/YqjD/DUF883 family membrane-anchored ribosome-binding protein
MSERSLRELEGDVERARARLLADLSVLSSPVAYSEFKDDLKEEARYTFRGIVENVKGRAAANPVATLAIGAGVAWRLLQHPPISTVLIGAGLLGLWKTDPLHPNAQNPDYLSTARTRLREQVGGLATTMGEEAADMAARVTERASDMTGTVAEQASDVAQTVRQKAHDLKDKAQDLRAQASEAIGDSAAAMTHRAETTFNDARRAVGNTSSRAVSMTNRVVGDADTMDALLLSVAGLAVAAALGIAYQRRAD